MDNSVQEAVCQPVYDTPETATAGIVTGSNLAISGRLGMPGRDYPAPAVSRKRFRELIALAYETVEWLEKKGLKKGEQCEFREIAERLWWKE